MRTSFKFPDRVIQAVLIAHVRAIIAMGQAKTVEKDCREAAGWTVSVTKLPRGAGFRLNPTCAA
jgi:hypothetical protein